MKPIINMALRLSLICAIAAFALANVAEVTRAPIAASEARAQREAVEAVLPSFARLAIDTLHTETGNPALYFSGVGDEGPTGTAFKSSSGLGYSGEIEIMMGVNPQGKISGVRVLRHAETPGLGANYAAPEMLDGFYKDRLIGDNWKLKKDGGEVDAVTGATITGRAIADAIETGLQKYFNDQNSIKAVVAPVVAPETEEGITP
jgi:electron transport complex protein RnfG